MNKDITGTRTSLLTRMDTIKKIASVGKEMEKLELSWAAGVNVK